MKKAPPVRLSLRKLFIAMLAVGPISILPSPLLAAVPQGTSPAVQPFTVLNGTAAWNGSGSVATINASDRAIVSWNTGSFNIATGETFSFLVPSGGSILNKVGYNTTGGLGTPDTAVINGTITATGRVFVLANGSISVGGGAVINTANGLFLSTLQETDNFTFATSGNLAFTGAPTGNITLGGGALTSVAGNLGAWAGNVSVNNLSVTGDMIVNQRTPGAGLVLTGASGNTTITGNLTVATANGAVTQGATSLSVGNVTSLATNGADVNLSSPGNSFNSVSATVGNLTLVDSSSIILGASTISGSLSVTAANDISTSGAVAVATNVSLTSTTAGNVTFASGSSVGGIFNASVANGNVSVNTVGSLTTGTISGQTGGGLQLGALPLVTGGSGYTAAPSVTFQGGGGTGATAIASVNTSGVVTSVTLTSAGTGYTSPPQVVLVGGGTGPSTPAVVTSVIGFPLNSISIPAPSGGAGYTTAPTVTIAPPPSGGVQATADAILSSGVVTGFTITNPGSGYATPPSIAFGPVPGTVTEANASAASVGLTPTGSLLATLPIVAPGAGFTTTPTVTFTGGGGTSATITASINTTLGTLLSVTTTGGTGFTSAPTLSFLGGGTSPTSAAVISPLSFLGSSTINVTTSGTLLINGPVNGGSVSFSGTSLNSGPSGSVTASGPAVFMATAGSIVLPMATASRFEVTSTGGSISQFARMEG